MLKKIMGIAAAMALIAANAYAECSHTWLPDSEMSDEVYSVYVCSECRKVSYAANETREAFTPAHSVTVSMENTSAERSILPNGWVMFHHVDGGEVVKVKCTPLWAEQTIRLEEIMAAKTK